MNSRGLLIVIKPALPSQTHLRYVETDWIDVDVLAVGTDLMIDHAIDLWSVKKVIILEETPLSNLVHENRTVFDEKFPRFVRVVVVTC